MHFFANNAVKRVFSLRHDLSNAFIQLVRSAPGASVQIEISDHHFPLFARGRTIQVDRGVLLLRTASGTAPAGFQISIDGTAMNAFALDPMLASLPGQPLPGGFTSQVRAQHTFTIDNAGDLAPMAAAPGDTAAIDTDKLLDVLLYLEYRLG